MIETPIEVVIGGKRLLCPPMPFYCLERAWPHIKRMGEMATANQALATAQLQVRSAVTAQDHEDATRAVQTAESLVGQLDGDLIGQTKEALHIIVAALSLETPAPTYDELSRTMRADEIQGVHLACSLLMDSSGLIVRNDTPALGEALAAKQAPTHNGIASSLN